MRLRNVLQGAASLGLASLAFGAWRSPEKFWPTVLLVGLYPLTVSLGAAIFVAIQNVSGARWSARLKPAAEALTRCYWPGAAVVMVALVFGHGQLYGWAQAAGDAAASQRQWLNPSFLTARSVLYLAAWGLLLRVIRSGAFAGLSLAAMGITLSLASFDWLMALEPGWSSTMFGVFVFAGAFLAALAAMTVAKIALGVPNDTPTQEELHDLGKMIFGFSMFWAYIWYCQYMLIWYTNNPEETSFFLRRHSGGWAVLSMTNVGLNWIVPFLVLLPVWTKRHASVLLRVSLVILAGHWLDLYITIMPRFANAGASFSPWEGLVFVGALAACALLLLPAAVEAGRTSGAATVVQTVKTDVKKLPEEIKS